MLSLEALQKKLIYAADNGTLPKIIIPVHLAGTSCSMRDIESLVRPYGIHILEDASHAVGGSYQGLPIGSCLYSDISVFSFHPVKIITTGEGGAATTNDSHLADQMLLLRSHGITKDAKRFEHEPAGPWCYEQQTQVLTIVLPVHLALASFSGSLRLLKSVIFFTRGMHLC